MVISAVAQAWVIDSGMVLSIIKCVLHRATSNCEATLSYKSSLPYIRKLTLSGLK